jgi:hypothetical protein
MNGTKFTSASKLRRRPDPPVPILAEAINSPESKPLK